MRMRNEERRKPRKRDGGKERRLPWRLIVSENPSSRSFCFRFYFLPSNPPVHCLPFVHTVPRASPIPASRDFYLVTFQAFLSLIWLLSPVVDSPLFLVGALFRFLRLYPTHKPASSSVSLVSPRRQRAGFNGRLTTVNQIFFFYTLYTKRTKTRFVSQESSNFRESIFFNEQFVYTFCHNLCSSFMLQFSIQSQE